MMWQKWLQWNIDELGGFHAVSFKRDGKYTQVSHQGWTGWNIHGHEMELVNVAGKRGNDG